MAAASAAALALLRRSARPQLATLWNVAVAATVPRALMSSGGNAPVPTAQAAGSTPAVVPEVRQQCTKGRKRAVRKGSLALTSSYLRSPAFRVGRTPRARSSWSTGARTTATSRASP